MPDKLKWRFDRVSPKTVMIPRGRGNSAGAGPTSKIGKAAVPWGRCTNVMPGVLVSRAPAGLAAHPTAPAASNVNRGFIHFEAIIIAESSLMEVGRAVNITVILCTLNGCRSLGKTLDSLAASTLPEGVEWEVLVVDNNS